MFVWMSGEQKQRGAGGGGGAAAGLRQSQRPHLLLGLSHGWSRVAPPPRPHASPSPAVSVEEAPPPRRPPLGPRTASSLLLQTLPRESARTTTRPAVCSLDPGGKRDMAATKPENLSVVMHGPGDLRLVKREGEWVAKPDPAPLAAAPAHQYQPCAGHALCASWPLRFQLVTMLGGGRRLEVVD